MVSKDSNILVVDDSPAIQALMREFLRSLGYGSVDAVSSAKEALERLDAVPYDIVFLDMVMPGEAGEDFAEEALAKNPTLKVVVTTALPYTHESVLSAISQGASDYLPKPLRMDAVKSIMQRLEREAQGIREIKSDVNYH
ncbi:MAG TPA: response regulator [Candidatus Thermoplasmatota archaeon]|nr:response regulator [Candidatus Thermoplasmatota archaeon]